MAEIKGGDKFMARLAEMATRVSRPGTLRVGFLEGATYPDGTPVALVAAVQNFGAPSRGIPPRPFFSNMVADEQAGWPSTLAQLLRRTDYDGEAALRLMGEIIRGQLQQAIRDFEGAPLAPETVARKGFDRALIDSGHMLNSVDYEVN